MDTDPSPVRLWDSEHSEGYRTAYEQPSELKETARAHKGEHGPRTQPGA